MTMKARGRDTAGVATVFEMVVGPKEEPPLHRRAREDEMWYVLAGRLRFRLDEDLLEAPAGSFVFAPHGTAHCFQNNGDVEARIFVVFTPAGMESFFDGHARLPSGPIDPDAYGRLAASAGMEVVGKPLDETHPFDARQADDWTQAVA
jgi:quercetin dioxygenase-like cupin family protein